MEVRTHTPHQEVAHRSRHHMSVDLQRVLHRAWAGKSGTRVVMVATCADRVLVRVGSLAFLRGSLSGAPLHERCVRQM